MALVSSNLKCFKYYPLLVSRDSGQGEDGIEVNASVEDEVQKMTSLKMGGKLRAFACIMEQPDTAKVGDTRTAWVIYGCLEMNGVTI